MESIRGFDSRPRLILLVSSNLSKIDALKLIELERFSEQVYWFHCCVILSVDVAPFARIRGVFGPASSVQYCSLIYQARVTRFIRAEFFVGVNDETPPVVAVYINNPNRSPVGINR